MVLVCKPTRSCQNLLLQRDSRLGHKIGDRQFVYSAEVVHFLECPVSEVR